MKDGWIYYVYGGQLNKMSLDGSVDIPLYTSERTILAIHYREGWLYLADGNFRILGSGTIDKLRIDGTGSTSLTTSRANSLYFAGDTLYVNYLWEGNSRLDCIPVE